MAKITKLEPTIPILKKRKRVAAYARVSMESERMLHSLSAQISYYSKLIQSNPEWEYAGVYADYGISGTGMLRREEFKRLLADCEAGRIDIIYTKSIQRFARNTVDLLQTVRHLKELGIEIRFEKERINTLSGDGELLLTLLASFAQEGSRSISENCKWGIVKRYEKGLPRGCLLYGYRAEKGEFSIVPEEAEVVRRMFQLYLEGLSCYMIAKKLTEEGVHSYYGKPFSGAVINTMLRQEKYAGHVHGQKFYTKDSLSHKELRNKGELPMFILEDAIPAIVDQETFDKVQLEIVSRYGVKIVNGIAGRDETMGKSVEKTYPNRRKAYWSEEQRAEHGEIYKSRNNAIPLRYELSRFMKCETCGENMVANTIYYADGSTETAWTPAQQCRRNHSDGRPVRMSNEALKDQIATAMGLPEFSENELTGQLTGITTKGAEVTLHYKDGKTASFQFIKPKHIRTRKES